MNEPSSPKVRWPGFGTSDWLPWIYYRHWHFKEVTSHYLSAALLLLLGLFMGLAPVAGVYPSELFVFLTGLGAVLAAGLWSGVGNAFSTLNGNRPEVKWAFGKAIGLYLFNALLVAYGGLYLSPVVEETALQEAYDYEAFAWPIALAIYAILGGLAQLGKALKRRADERYIFGAARDDGSIHHWRRELLQNWERRYLEAEEQAARVIAGVRAGQIDAESVLDACPRFGLIMLADPEAARHHADPRRVGQYSVWVATSPADRDPDHRHRKMRLLLGRALVRLIELREPAFVAVADRLPDFAQVTVVYPVDEEQYLITRIELKQDRGSVILSLWSFLHYYASAQWTEQKTFYPGDYELFRDRWCLGHKRGRQACDVLFRVLSGAMPLYGLPVFVVMSLYNILICWLGPPRPTEEAEEFRKYFFHHYGRSGDLYALTWTRWRDAIPGLITISPRVGIVMKELNQRVVQTVIGAATTAGWSLAGPPQGNEGLIRV